jgi:LysR family hydrogen peroxide-inducible transcriptional activator
MVLPTLRQLEYLRLLADQGSFSRAADAAHVTQPTLSAGIQELEKILGSPVVDRGRAGVILTSVGEEALRRAQAILAQAEDLVEAAQSAGAPLVGRFRLGVIPTIAPFLLPKALPRLRARYPRLKLYLREDQTQRLILALKAGEVDAALIALPYDIGGLEWARVADDELLAALPADHRLANAGALSPEVLRNDAMILLEDGHCLRDHALAACGFAPPKPGSEDTVAATSLPTLVQMVASGLGVSFLPAMAVEAGLADRASISVHPLDAARSSREIVVCWRAGSSRRVEGRLLAEAFREGSPEEF